MRLSTRPFRTGLLALLVSSAAVHAAEPAVKKTTSGNPIAEGWYADPEGEVFGKEYWVYPTSSDVYEKQIHFDAFSSPDLVNWTSHPNVLTNKEIPWAKRAMWAPSVVAKGGKYYFFFAANDIQNDNEAGGIGVAVADSPAGPYKDYLGQPLVAKYYNGAQPIDVFTYHDDDGRWFLIYGGHGHCNIGRLADDFKSIMPAADGTLFKEITPQGYVEGPFMFRKGGKYYFMWSEGGWTGPGYKVAYAISDSVTGPFKRIGTILEQDPAIATGAGHHSVIHNPKSDKWYIVYHRRPIGDTGRDHRVTCIDVMEFNADGTIKPVVMTKEGVKADPLR